MDELIEALTIFKKYVEPDSYEARFPTHCEHDVLYVYIGVSPDVMDEGDPERLEELGFEWELELDETWSSFRFGSC